MLITSNQENVRSLIKPLSTTSPAAIAAVQMVTPNKLSSLLLKRGPLAIRHITQTLSEEIPSFKDLSSSKQRRLIMSVMESGDESNNVVFEKIGWGQWNAKIVNENENFIDIRSLTNLNNAKIKDMISQESQKRRRKNNSNLQQQQTFTASSKNVSVTQLKNCINEIENSKNPTTIVEKEEIDDNKYSHNIKLIEQSSPKKRFKQLSCENGKHFNNDKDEDDDRVQNLPIDENKYDADVDLGDGEPVDDEDYEYDRNHNIKIHSRPFIKKEFEHEENNEIEDIDLYNIQNNLEFMPHVNPNAYYTFTNVSRVRKPTIVLSDSNLLSKDLEKAFLFQRKVKQLGKYQPNKNLTRKGHNRQHNSNTIPSNNNNNTNDNDNINNDNHNNEDKPKFYTTTSGTQKLSKRRLSISKESSIRSTLYFAKNKNKIKSKNNQSCLNNDIPRFHQVRKNIDTDINKSFHSETDEEDWATIGAISLRNPKKNELKLIADPKENEEDSNKNKNSVSFDENNAACLLLSLKS
ncbi:hypothetical protein Kpol_397p8 [Vanderwaltozyma polyspora DSM 70294]|uniref:Protein STB3 n=1 Tax=Vanderwaltozyma polyspora (strain ATCC 22028 / DSM 70294 / BCRC 21397 / CBS 2163 / NBRC 10782 / NRRL Y-8283 / UCD 57-17) TaxID=436907 RepID=A7TRG0_VANPO|nr:uncharacterized protein Kpol_397p8 [Vanderwaltozyma polyspora DSM 70294]EDO15149.1 hypothetical protein Kpol_397p8 [Vanderwaltozyma polyspora DSM 70294]